jgi:hypothetical protein
MDSAAVSTNHDPTGFLDVLSPDVLSLDVLSPDVLSPDVLSLDVLSHQKLKASKPQIVHQICRQRIR